MAFLVNANEGNSGEDDPLYSEVKEFCRNEAPVAVATIQRKFKTTYWRASAMVRALHEEGVYFSPTTRGAAGIKNGR